MYTLDQVEAAARLLRFDDPSSGDCTYAADILDAHAATLKAAQGGVAEAMVESVIASVARVNTDGMDGDSWDRILVRAALEAALSAEPAAHGEMSMLFGACRITGPRADVLHIAKIIGEPEETAPPAQPADSKVIGDDLKVKPGKRVLSDLLKHVDDVILCAWAFGAQKVPLFRDLKEAYDAMLSATPPAQPAERVPEGMALVPYRVVECVRAASQPGVHPRAVPQLIEQAMDALADMLASPAPSEGGKGVGARCYRTPEAARFQAQFDDGDEE